MARKSLFLSLQNVSSVSKFLTVSPETLKLKIEAAKNRIHVDVGFWGGLVPDNTLNSSALESLLDAGVLGLKSFMCPSGINDFPMTNITQHSVAKTRLKL
ncbi:Allantoinase [Cardamine amara subsp. amara]|uniref:Allantoinase n=1 Tax=Cardamine amara subsp. amara TaxID=228776 RepID=A0ABD1BB91_CARAN